MIKEVHDEDSDEYDTEEDYITRNSKVMTINNDLLFREVHLEKGLSEEQ